MQVLTQSIIYENPLPQLRSRQAAFPFLTETADGKIIALYQIGEAFESVDGATYASISTDGGKSFGKEKRVFREGLFGVPFSECAKATGLKDGRLIAIGYGYIRDNPDYPIGNPETGGLLDDILFVSFSYDNGESWSEPREITSAWGRHVEASAPVTELASGTLITPITGFPDWSGTPHGRNCGRALVSHDGGESWSDDAVCMEFPGDTVTCYEQRMCQLASGTIVDIAWCEDTVSGERLPNHYTVSRDGGKTWSAPKSTGVRGQASSVCAIGGERLLALHAVRRDTDRPGIYAYIVDLACGEWNILEEMLVWEPPFPVTKDTKMAEIFSYLKFGQPGAILLSDGDIMMSHWYADQGQYKTVATRIKL